MPRPVRLSSPRDDQLPRCAGRGSVQSELARLPNVDLPIPEVLIAAEHSEHYEALVQSLRSGNCCVFIGAGLSISAGYPDWPALVDLLASEARNVSGGLISQSGDPHQDAETCRQAMGEETYWAFLVDQFGPSANKHATTTDHEQIDKLPFKAFITTNIDPCLPNASHSNGTGRQLHIYPNLSASYLRDGHIFHVHGIVSPRDPLATAQLTILTSRDYQRAYRMEEELNSFYYQLFHDFDVLFIGFSLSDSFFMETLAHIRQARLSLGATVSHAGLRLSENNCYAFLTRPIKSISAPDEVEGPASTGSHPEQWLPPSGILPIWYDPITPSHLGMEKILRDLHARTALTPVSPFPLPHGFESLRS